MTNKFYVRPTFDRSDSSGDYIARISPSAAAKYLSTFGQKLPSVVAIVNVPTHLESVEIVAIGRLYVRELEKPEADRDDLIEMDQTLRQALGIAYRKYKEVQVTVFPLKHHSALKDWFARIMGRRLVYCRPAVLRPVEIEKRISRLPSEVLDLVGVNSGDWVVMVGIEKTANGDYIERRRRMPALRADNDYIENYAKLCEPQLGARYPDVGEMLYPGNSQRIDHGVELHQAFIDMDARNTLFGSQEHQKYRCDPKKAPPGNETDYYRSVQCTQPILIYRDPVGASLSEMVAFGLTFGLQTLAIAQIFPALSGLYTATIAIFVSVALVVFKTRNAIR